MAKIIKKQLKTNTEKQFLEIFHSLSQYRNSWEVWYDFITATAISIHNALCLDDLEKNAEYEKEFASCMERLGDKEKAAQMLALIVTALEENPEQDFLGSIFMALNLGNHWKGQFFTPYSVCKAMSEITIGNAGDEIKNKGWISVNDPACGAGATLIAAANTIKNRKINYQKHVLFVAQDIDRIAGMMCYIQLSLLGCPGYVVIGDSICNPVVGGDILNPIPDKEHEIFYTPMYYAFRLLKGSF